MKHFKLFLFTITTFLVLNSCQKDFENATSENINQGKSELVSFSYKGKVYSSTYKLSSDSIPIWDDSEVGKLYDELNELPELATLINKDGSIALFDNSNELNEYLANIPRLKILDLSVVDATLWVYDDKNKLGAGLKFNLVKGSDCIYDPQWNNYSYYSYAYIKIPKLSAYNFEDRISSFWMTCTPADFDITLYEHADYQGRSITFSRSFNELYIQNLDDYIMQKPSFSKHTIKWNNQVSSIIATYSGYDLFI